MTHICVGDLTIIGSDNGLSPGRRQAIIWTIAGLLLIGPLGTNLSEILIGVQTFSLHLKKRSAKWRPFCPGLNVLSNGSASYEGHSLSEMTAWVDDYIIHIYMECNRSWRFSLCWYCYVTMVKCYSSARAICWHGDVIDTLDHYITFSWKLISELLFPFGPSTTEVNIISTQNFV